MQEHIYDWNEREQAPRIGTVELFDETLRDGLQSPSVVDPPIEQKLTLLRMLDGLGVAVANVGLPCAGPRAFEDALAMARFVKQEGLTIRLAFAARTVVKDIEPIARVQDQTGVSVQAYTFIGSSPIRFFAENWSQDSVVQNVAEAVKFSVSAGLETCLVTEDTTRASPDMLRDIFTVGLEAGASALCLCDTVGHATPHGVRSLVTFTQQLLAKLGRPEVRLDWHGHNDRGLGVVNALVAAEAGVRRIHGSALGVGERVGNAAIDQIIVNLKLLGAYPHDITQLAAFVELASQALKVEIPSNYPMMGRDAFRTSTGVHAAAIIKALRKNDRDLADRVYSAVPASVLGRSQEIEVGPMSGLSNVNYWLEQHGVTADDALAKRILERAKQSNRALTDAELKRLVDGA